MFTWHVSLKQPSTTDTVGLVQQEMADFQPDRRQFDHLLGIVRRCGSHCAMSTDTRRRIQVVHLGRLKQDRSGARMALLCPTFTGCLATCGRFERRIRRQWRTGGVRRLVQTSLQLFNLLLELATLMLQLFDLIVQLQDIVLDCRGCLMPALLSKGERPSGIGMRLE
jgi:hypothetical protein